MRLQRTGAEEAAPSISTTNGQAQCTKPPPLAKTLSQCLWEACALVATWEARAPCSDIVAVSQRGACLCTTLCRRESNAPATTLSVRHREASPCKNIVPVSLGGACSLQRHASRASLAATLSLRHREAHVPATTLSLCHREVCAPCSDVGGARPLQRRGRRLTRRRPPLQRQCRCVTGRRPPCNDTVTLSLKKP